MVLHHTNNTISRVTTLSAPGSTFNNVGRDQITNINLSLVGSYNRCTHPHCHLPLGPNDGLSQPATGPDYLSDGRHLVPYRSDAFPDIETATGLIGQITNLLGDRRDLSRNRHDLVLELESLHQTLTLTKLTSEKYDKTPLGQSLANTVAPEVNICFVALQELLGSIDGIRRLNFTRIGDLWHWVWWAMLGGDEFALLRKKLSYSRQLFQELLITLHSCVLPDLQLFHSLKYFRIRR